MNLTKEQREAIELGLGEIGTAVFRNHGVNEIKEKKLLAADAVLRDFLSGSKPAWEATEKRIHSLRYILGEIAESDKYLASSTAFEFLHIMLEEAQP